MTDRTDGAGKTADSAAAVPLDDAALRDRVAELRSGFGAVDSLARFRAPVNPEEPTEVPDEVVIALADGVPAPGFTSYATVDMGRFPTNVTDADGREVATELVTVGRTAHRAAADVLARAAFAIAAGSIHVVPLAVIPSAVAEADPDRTMRHLLLVLPFLWPELEILAEPDTADGTVRTRLQAVPISDSELAYADTHGRQALFDLLESAGADVSDIDRRPVA